ncbi:uncharacterized protein BYT42DRAFT_503929, partial [Radiomyces spectabilis]|uniref:uncharacterized protein n=1 Tax=Radiomyces spectabilis TaxID=64574 RepID=UPI00221F5D78
YSPREAAKTIVRLVNSRNLNEALLALTLLDNCVKNCGYPFHLQIATKEFLNELVRKFPERPAPFPNQIVQRILYLIKEWKVALTDMSRHKDDLVHIKDMYRLLRFKGYRFPELRDSSVAALAPSESLKSAEELEEEDRLAQSAKLQELIRRGRPQDLVEANHLMKIMSGYDQRSKPNYKQKFEEELHKIQDKTILFYEMLENIKAGEKLKQNDTIMELKNACSGAQPKLQKMITEKLLTLNDMINNAMAKFADIQKGLFNTSYEISGKPPTQTNASEAPTQAISLIDLDDMPSTQSSGPVTPAQSSSTSVLDELSDLFGQSAAITTTATSLGSPAAQQTASPVAPLDFLSQPVPATSTTRSASSAPAAASPVFSNTMLSAGLNTTLSLSNPGTPSTFSLNSTGSAQSVAHDTSNMVLVILVNKNGLHIELEVQQRDTIWTLKALFSNRSTAPMENLTLRLAAPKSMQLKMESQSSQTIPSKTEKTVTQIIKLNNPNKEPLRLRYKVTYEQFGVEMEQSGDYHA